MSNDITDVLCACGCGLTFPKKAGYIQIYYSIDCRWKVNGKSKYRQMRDRDLAVINARPDVICACGIVFKPKRVGDTHHSRYCQKAQERKAARVSAGRVENCTECDKELSLKNKRGVCLSCQQEPVRLNKPSGRNCGNCRHSRPNRSCPEIIECGPGVAGKCLLISANEPVLWEPRQMGVK